MGLRADDLLPRAGANRAHQTARVCFQVVAACRTAPRSRSVREAEKCAYFQHVLHSGNHPSRRALAWGCRDQISVQWYDPVSREPSKDLEVLEAKGRYLSSAARCSHACSMGRSRPNGGPLSCMLAHRQISRSLTGQHYPRKWNSDARKTPL